ncbi:MAG: hypothetical protein IK084_01200, partial [Bacteroidaceae bacterium]|nr:hypothetical protein [Bacteroidaceae bacterium]
MEKIKDKAKAFTEAHKQFYGASTNLNMAVRDLEELAYMGGYKQCLLDIGEAAQHLSERVDQYLVQGCSRAELKAANEGLKNLLNKW